MKKSCFPLLALAACLSLTARADWGHPSPYPQGDACWLIKMPIAGTTIELRKPLTIEAGQDNVLLGSDPVWHGTESGTFFRGNIWLMAKLEQAVARKRVIPKKTEYVVERIEYLHPPIKNCMEVRVKGPEIASFDLCSDFLDIIDLRIADFKNAFPGGKLKITAPRDKFCWVPHPEQK